MTTASTCQIITDEHARDERFSGNQYIRVTVISKDKRMREETVRLLRESYNARGYAVTSMENGQMINYPATVHYTKVVIVHYAEMPSPNGPAGNEGSGKSFNGNPAPFDRINCLKGRHLEEAVREAYGKDELPDNLYLSPMFVAESPDGAAVQTRNYAIPWKGDLRTTLDALCADAERNNQCAFLHGIRAPNGGVCTIRGGMRRMHPVYDELRKIALPRHFLRGITTIRFETDGLRQIAEAIIRRLKSEESAKPACTCDAHCDSPCPVHRRENELQDAWLEARNTIRDYEASQADVDRLVRELDVLLNGIAGAAPQARLCDIVSQVRDNRWKLVRANVFHASIRVGLLHGTTEVLCAIETDGGHLLIAHPDAPPKVEGMAMHWRAAANLPEWIRKGRLC
jgi:hypothetical protein